jgi:hypothetical protein
VAHGVWGLKRTGPLSKVPVQLSVTARPLCAEQTHRPELPRPQASVSSVLSYAVGSMAVFSRARSGCTRCINLHVCAYRCIAPCCSRGVLRGRVSPMQVASRRLCGQRSLSIARPASLNSAFIKRHVKRRVFEPRIGSAKCARREQRFALRASDTETELVEPELVGEDAAVFDVSSQSLKSWALFFTLLTAVLGALYVVRTSVLSAPPSWRRNLVLRSGLDTTWSGSR